MKNQNMKTFKYINLATTWILILSVFTYANLPTLNEDTPQISGVAFFDTQGNCADPEYSDATFALTMTGNLQGCLYTFVEYSRCSPSGVYFEQGRETFVGNNGERYGTFSTTYNFEAKYRDCRNLVGEVVGRCQHPIVRNSGTGDFENVWGRLDFKDDVQTGNFLYRGHLLW